MLVFNLLYIIFCTHLLYHICRSSGVFDILHNPIVHLTIFTSTSAHNADIPTNELKKPLVVPVAVAVAPAPAPVAVELLSTFRSTPQAMSTAATVDPAHTYTLYHAHYRTLPTRHVSNDKHQLPNPIPLILYYLLTLQNLYTYPILFNSYQSFLFFTLLKCILPTRVCVIFFGDLLFCFSHCLFIFATHSPGVETIT